ncbi:TVP38/TMEM64 family protein [Verrucomicrobiales bacterium]|jgi:uncharacterized membrane protein YdjX (TVP38/TMEM64 family)|nr:TVP38/TMEM64 family protein [Verrucomicrobiales bacterium]MDB4358695.1 TVP38/TMEM64 family protein [Verrucomicrobiales bacterium]|tara:strand:+ start:281 stop:994 length:714 start_codon:yes stop_codon:yes gene_type:complete
MDTLPPESETPSSKKTFIIGAIALIAIFIGFKFLPLDEWFKVLGDWIESLGPWGPIAFIVSYVLLSLFLIPGSALTASAGLFFGLGGGTLWVVVAANLAANIAFLIGRYRARDMVMKRLEGNEKFSAIDDAVGREGWKIVGLTRLSPLFPFTLINYGFGVTKVSWLHYALASLVGMAPGTIMYVYFGSLGKLAVESGEKSTTQIVVQVIGLLVTIAVTVYVTRVAKKALAKRADVEA